MSELGKFALAFAATVTLALVAGVAFRIGQHNPSTPPGLPVNVKTPKTDVKIEQQVITIRDTIREKTPVYLTKYVDRVELVPVTDTIRRVDTLYMAVEIERRTYQGDDYRAVVSGWRPSLEEIAVYPKTVYLQTEVTQPPAPASRRGPRAGIGIAAGPGAFWTPQAGVQFGAGAVVGLSITF